MMESMRTKLLVVAVRSVFCAGLVAGTLAATASLGHAASSVQHYQIAAGALDQVLTRFATQAGVALAFDQATVRHIQSQGLHGQFSVAQAFQQILKATPFQAEKTNTGYRLVSKPSSTHPVYAGELEQIDVNAVGAGKTQAGVVSQLPALQVTASKGLTEGTGSYTIDTMRTATKLNLSIRDTPQMVKVYSREYLDDTNTNSYQELLNSVTGVTINRWDERLYPTARGFDVDYYLIDGIPTYTISDSSASDLDLAMYDHVEVVKGANGLMTGAGNPAIGLNFIRKHATAKQLTGSLKVSVGSWNAYSSQADLSGPLNEDGSVRGRVVLKHEDSQSFMDGYHKLRNLAYGILDIDLGERTLLSLGASIDDLDRSGIRWGGLPAFYSDMTRTHFDRAKTVSADWTYWNTQTNNYFVNFQHTFVNDFSLNLAYSYQDILADTSLLYFGGSVDKATGTGEGYVYRYANNYKNSEQNIDAYLSMPFKVGSLAQEILFGYMYNQSKLKQNDWGMDYPVSSLSNPIINLYHLQIADPNLSLSNTTTPYQTTQSGWYLASKLQLLDPLKLIAGVRLSNWEYSSETGSANRKFDHEITPYVGVIYDLNQQHSLYASYTDIFKPQEYRDVNGNYLDPVTGKNYEAGIKAEYFAGQLNAALAIFRIEQQGVGEALTGVFVPGTSSTAYRAMDGVTSKGIEFEVDGQLSEAWNLSFGIAHFKAEDAQGNAVVTKSNRTSANLFSKYRWNKLSLGGGINFKSKAYTIYQNAIIEQKAYALVNLMAGYQVDKNIKVQLNVNNLLDKEYYEGIGSDGMVYGAPRHATLSLNYDF
jgi:outer membrane receptor for ferric coprogen and ferric-rhodotorulic acid